MNSFRNRRRHAGKGCWVFLYLCVCIISHLPVTAAGTGAESRLESTLDLESDNDYSVSLVNPMEP